MRISKVLCTSFACCGALATLLGGTTLGQTVRSGIGEASGDQTETMLRQTARNDDMQIALAEIGARKAEDPRLKEYCLRFQHEEIQVNEQFKSVARAHSARIDQALTKQDVQELSKLQGLSGAKFDRSLTQFLLREERRDIAKMGQAESASFPADVRQYFEQNLPKARQRLEQTQSLARDLGIQDDSAATPAIKRPE